MRYQRYQEILQDVRRVSWTDVLLIAKKNFQMERLGEEVEAFFKCSFYSNWRYYLPATEVGAYEIVSCLEALSEEAVFCMDSIIITPTIVCGDEKISLQDFRFKGNVASRWQQLHLRVDGKDTVISRDALVAGTAVAETQSGEIYAYVADDTSLILMSAEGRMSPVLLENNEYYIECFPGVEAMIEYDHTEYPALWTCLYLDDGHSKNSNWKEHLQEGEICYDYRYIKDENQPVVSVVEISERSLTLRLEGHGLNETVVLDKPNLTEVIWKKGKRFLKATLYVPEPRVDKAMHYHGNQHLSALCRASFALSHNGEEASWTQEIRDLYCYIDRPDQDGPYWQLPCIWGFEEGKMVLGSTSPDVKAGFIALVPEGETCSLLINDKGSWWEYGDDYNEASLSICWNNVDAGLEVVDAVLMSVPDQKELVVPTEALSIDYKALRRAPSLEKIIIHAGVTGFSYAIDDFVRTHHRKLDVVFEGSLQDWFTRAYALSGKIGSLFVDGKEQDFYGAEHFVVPEGVNCIGGAFFQNNDTLESVVLGPEVTVIENDAFRGCKKLRSVKVMGPAVIGESAFSGCKVLEEVYLADGVAELADGVFDWVTTMESVYIPASVQKVGRISHQNDGSYVAPTFLCEAASKPDGWYKEWNLSYYDPRFGLGHGYDHYHPVNWDCKRK